MMRRSWHLSVVLGAGLLLGLGTAGAIAHDGNWSGTMSLGDSIYMEHPDAEPWAGWVNVTVTNTGNEPWGDFHFEIFSVGGYDVSNVDWIVDPPFEPTSTQSPLTWLVDNVTVGATIDLFYYSDPVWPGDTATFSVYNVNPDHVPFFGVAFYPTPIPEPGTIMMLGLGVWLFRRR